MVPKFIISDEYAQKLTGREPFSNKVMASAKPVPTKQMRGQSTISLQIT